MLSEQMVTVRLCCPHAWHLGTAWGKAQACGPLLLASTPPHPTLFYKYPTAHWLPSCCSNSFHEVIFPERPPGTQHPHLPFLESCGLLAPARGCPGCSVSAGRGVWALGQRPEAGPSLSSEPQVLDLDLGKNQACSWWWAPLWASEEQISSC